MDLPSFEEYKKTLDEDKRTEIMERVFNKENGTDKIEIAPTQESLNELLGASFGMSLSLLADYHQWLSQVIKK